MAMHFSYDTFEFPAEPTEEAIFWESFRQITTFSATVHPDNTLPRGLLPSPRRGLCAKSRPGARCSILPLHRLHKDDGMTTAGHLRRYFFPATEANSGADPITRSAVRTGRRHPSSVRHVYGDVRAAGGAVFVYSEAMLTVLDAYGQSGVEPHSGHK